MVIQILFASFVLSTLIINANIRTEASEQEDNASSQKDVSTDHMQKKLDLNAVGNLINRQLQHQQRRFENAITGTCKEQDIDPTLIQNEDVIRLKDALARQVQMCFTGFNPEQRYAGLKPIRIAVNLCIDGSLMHEPIPEIDTNIETDIRYKEMILGVKRAIINCSPYKLPKEEYSLWKEILLVFPTPSITPAK